MERDLVREYLAYLRVEKGLAANSIDAYGSDLAKLSEWASKNGIGLLNLDRTDLREWLIDLSRTELSESSKRRLISSVRGFYKFLMIDGHLTKSPAEDIATPQKGLYLPKFLNQTEVEMLLSQPDVSTETGLRDRAILELMYSSGLRVSEAVNLQIRDVDLDSGILTCTGKGNKTRRVPVGASAVEWLKSYLALRRKNEKIEIQNLFVSPVGKAANSSANPFIYKGLCQAMRSGRCFAAYSSTFVCHASCSKPRRYSLGPTDARARRYFDDSDLHAHHRRTSEKGIRRFSSPLPLKIENPPYRACNLNPP